MPLGGRAIVSWLMLQRHGAHGNESPCAPNGSRLSCGARKKDSFHNLRERWIRGGRVKVVRTHIQYKSVSGIGCEFFPDPY